MIQNIGTYTSSSVFTPSGLPSSNSGNGKESDPTPSDERSSAVIVSLSSEATSFMASSMQDPVTLPETLVTAVRSDMSAFEIQLRAQQPPRVTDYGQIGRAVNSHYSQLMGIAYGVVGFVNGAVTVDPALDMSKTDNVAIVNEIKETLYKTAYASMTKGAQSINGPGSSDISASAYYAALRNTNFVIGSGVGPDGVAGSTTYNPDGTHTIRLWPDAITTNHGSRGPIIAANTVLFHELGHAMPYGQADSDAQYGSYVSRTGGASGYAGSPEFILAEMNAMAAGFGLSQLVGVSHLVDPTLTRRGMSSQ